MNRKKIITCALLLLCATGLRAMDSDTAAADAAAREDGSALRQRGGGAGSEGDAVAAALLASGGDGATAAARGLTREQMIARAGRAGRHLRARDVRAALQALREDHRGAEEVADAVCCGTCAAGSFAAVVYVLYVLVPAAMNQWAASSYPS